MRKNKRPRTMKTCRPIGRYLENETELRVRFQEVDSLRVVWHGHYLSYFEDARAAFGDTYGIGYQDILDAGLIAPIVQVAVEYCVPALFNEKLLVQARLFERETAKIEYHYEVIRPEGNVLCARGYTVQAFLDLDQELVVTRPDFLRNFFAQWTERMKTTDA